MSTIWSCKIGTLDSVELPLGSDQPMRRAVQDAYMKLTGRDADFCFSGWGAQLTDVQEACVSEKPEA